ncbi:MAG: hypothetical protein ABR530_01285 [Pyrinomonadaceae bacterium]
MSAYDNKLAADFLLGRVSEQQRANIEQSFITDQQSFEHLLQAENDLVDDYVADRLSADDRRQFESIVLPRQKQKVEFARAMAAYAAANATADTPAPAVESWREWFSGIFTIAPAYSVGFSAAAILVALTAIFLLNRTSEPDRAAIDTPAPQQIAPTLPPEPGRSTDTSITVPPSVTAPVRAEKPSSELAPATRPKNVPAAEHQRSVTSLIATIMLAPGLTRGDGSSPASELPNKEGVVRLQLPPEQGEYRRYAIVVETVDGQQVWNQRVSAGAGTISTTVPRKRLSRGDYIVTLKGIDVTGLAQTLNEYTFSIK